LSWSDVGKRVIEQIGIDVTRVNWFSTYRVHHRVADSFRKGRAFLLGDAAHIHSPVGGQIRIMTVRGRSLRVAVRGGSPQWPPLLLCNGIGASLELLQPFVDALDPRREVVRFDMPGIGGSPAPVVPYHLWTLAPLLSGLLDQLGHQQADVLGMSWGGGLAQQFAVRCPSRVRQLVLVATSSGALMVPGHPRALLRMLTPRRHRGHGYAPGIAGELYGGSVRDDHLLARELLHATTRPITTRGYHYQLLATAGWTSLPLLPLVLVLPPLEQPAAMTDATASPSAIFIGRVRPLVLVIN